ncbi:MAG: hypothetical protein A4E44_00656 [Methanosaeta sp. PtaB.Bin018]|jgi:hypothetical protein|nr:MAG: hypothetical protein A4E44_00656 [Methanosaeta sp. PtaB.Bin018]
MSIMKFLMLLLLLGAFHQTALCETTVQYSGYTEYDGRPAELVLEFNGAAVRGTLSVAPVCEQYVHLTGVSLSLTGTATGPWEDRSTTISGAWTGGDLSPCTHEYITGDPAYPNTGTFTISMTTAGGKDAVRLVRMPTGYGYIFQAKGSRVTPAGVTTGSAACDWSGRWETNWGTMTLQQVGDSVTGDYTHDQGRIAGRVVGNKLIGTWSEYPTYSPSSDAGDAELTISEDCRTFTGRWRYGSVGEWSGDWTGTRASTEAEETLILETPTLAAVYNAPTVPTIFTLESSMKITKIRTYHWNSGQGMTPGSISLRDSAGNTYGPWQAYGEPGMGGVPNAYWVVEPDVVLPPGTYEVVDSDPSTWSQNSETGGRGVAWVYAIPAE